MYVGLGLLLGALVLYLFVLARNRAPAEMSFPELQGVRHELAAERNGFYVLLAATNQIHLDEFEGTNYPAFREQTLGTNWNAELARAVLATNQAALAAWDAAWQIPGFQVPKYKLEDELPYLGSWKAFAWLSLFRARIFWDEGRNADGFTEWLKLLRAGAALSDADGVVIHYLVGASIQHLALNCIRWPEFAAMTNQTELKTAIAELEKIYRQNLIGWTNSIRGENQMQLQWLADLRNGKVRTEDLPSGIFAVSAVIPLFSFSSSQRLFCDASATLIQDGAAPYTQRRITKFEKRPGIGSMLMSGNFIGEMFFFMLFPSSDATLQRQKSLAVSIQSTRLILVLRAYQLAHGSLPETLDALVPEFLDKVPADDFDGQPLRYSREKKMVYSVGKNLADDGGDDRDSEEKDYKQRHLDLVERFPF